jgi:hypothetical protein
MYPKSSKIRFCIFSPLVHRSKHAIKTLSPQFFLGFFFSKNNTRSRKYFSEGKNFLRKTIPKCRSLQMDVQRFFYPSDGSPKVESWLASVDPSLQPVSMLVTSAGTVLAMGSPTPQSLPIIMHNPDQAASSAVGSQRSLEQQHLPAVMRMTRATAASNILAQSDDDGEKHRLLLPVTSEAADLQSVASAAPPGLVTARFACNVCGLDDWLQVDSRAPEVRYCPACGMIQRWR